MVTRYKITIEYDGTNYCGWQKQKTVNSVQESIEKAIYKILNEKTDIMGSGRTDAGVHAYKQVAHFDLTEDKDAFKLMGGINHFLRDENIVILDCKKVRKDFHARFDAKSREYEYLILNRIMPAIIDKNRVWHVPVKLDVKKMHEAAQILAGSHDFSSFRDTECQAKSPVKTIDSIIVKKLPNDFIKIKVKAPSFLHHQIRIIAGSLVEVGTGKWQKHDLKEALLAKDRKKAGPTAPAYGLYFKKVSY